MQTPAQIIEKALIQAFPGQSEAAKNLYRFEMAAWLSDALSELTKSAMLAHAQDARDLSFRAFQRTYSVRLGRRDALVSWSEQQMWSAARGWGWSAQGDEKPIITVVETDTGTTLKGAMQSMIAGNEMLTAPPVLAGQPCGPIANNYIEFVWDSYLPVALSLFPDGVAPTTNYEDANALLSVVIEQQGALSVYSQSDNLVNPDQTIMLTQGNRIKADFAADGSITIRVYNGENSEVGAYPVRRWCPGGRGDGSTVAFAATTIEEADARMVALALAPSGGSAPVLVNWQQAEALDCDAIKFSPLVNASIGDYLLASFAFEQNHLIETDSQNRGDLTPTIEGMWTGGGAFNTELIFITLVDVNTFRWTSNSNPAGTVLNFSTMLQSLGSTGLSIRWSKKSAATDELENTYEITPFSLTAPTGWSLLKASATTDNFINVVYGHEYVSVDREFAFYASAAVDVLTQLSAYSGVDTLAPISQSANNSSNDAVSHSVAFVTAPTSQQTIALFFANKTNARFQHELVDIAPLRITESCVPVVSFGEKDAQIKNVRIGNVDAEAVPLPRDYPLVMESIYTCGSVRFESTGKPLSWAGDTPINFLPRIAGLWFYKIVNNTIKIFPAIPSASAVPPSDRLLITACVVLKCQELQANYDTALIDILVAKARERAGMQKNRK